MPQNPTTDLQISSGKFDNTSKVSVPGYNRKLSEFELYTKYSTQHDRAVAFEEKNWEREKKSIACYWGIDNELGLGQWPGGVVSEMIDQRRMISTFNLCRPTVDNIAGEIMQSPFGFKYSPVDGKLTTLTEKTNRQIYADQELMDWRSTRLEMVIGGLIYRSDVEMFKSNEYNKKTGNIGLRCLLPGTVIYSPDHKSNLSKDCKWADKTSYLSAKNILDIFGKDKESRYRIIKSVMYEAFGKQYLEKLAEWEYRYGSEYGDNTGAIPYESHPDIWGTKFKVIEHFEMHRVTKKYEYVLTEDGDEITIPEELKDASDKIRWLNETVPGWIPDQVLADETQENIQFVTTYCPGLTTKFILAHGPTEIQCGRLQFFPWSAFRLNGEYGGIIDAIIDIQRLINYWESSVVHKMQTEGTGGSQFVEEDYFESPEECDDYIQNRNNPQRVFKLKKNTLRTLPNGPAVPTSKSQFPAETYKHLEHLVQEMWPRLSRVTPASRGQSESDQESGVLFQQKRLQSQIEKYVIHESLRNWYNELGEAYIMQASHQYAGERREFYNPATKETIVWNERVTVTDDNGYQMDVIIDDISELRKKRHKVSIVESPDSPTRKVEIMRTSTDAMKAIPQTRVLTHLDLSQKILMNIDVITEDDDAKAELEENYKFEKEAAMQQLKTTIAQNRLTELQSIIAAQEIEKRLENEGAQLTQTTGNPLVPPRATGAPEPGAIQPFIGQGQSSSTNSDKISDTINDSPSLQEEASNISIPQGVS